MKFARVIVAALFMLVFVPALVPTASAASTKTCSDFSSQKDATSYLNALRALDTGLADELDPDGDGQACEDLPKNSGTTPTKEPARTSSGTTSSSTKLTGQEQTFLSDLQSQTMVIGEASDTLQKQFTLVSEDATVILDQSWITKTAGALAMMQAVDTDAHALKPSARQQHLYITWTDATSLISSAADDFARGFDNIDADSIVAGTAKITQATQLANGLTEDLKAFKDDPNVVSDQAKVISGPVSECSAFPDYNVAQVYLALNPDEQSTIDPNGDGRACEIFFDRAA
ncbi:MAG: excalibur calcium-binding domain-containing protein [Thermomicrobiales bacterium]